MILSSVQVPADVTSANVASSVVSQLSASSVTSPVRVKSVGSCSQLIIIAAGGVNVGKVTSCIVIVCVLFLTLPQSSVRDHFLETVPEKCRTQRFPSQ